MIAAVKKHPGRNYVCFFKTHLSFSQRQKIGISSFCSGLSGKFESRLHFIVHAYRCRWRLYLYADVKWKIKKKIIHSRVIWYTSYYVGTRMHMMAVLYVEPCSIRSRKARINYAHIDSPSKNKMVNYWRLHGMCVRARARLFKYNI